MKTLIVSIKDNAVGAYQAPFTVRAQGEALRHFMDAINGNTNYARHAKDFDLYKIGTFDDDTGFIETLEHPELLVKGITVAGRDSNDGKRTT